MISVWKSSVYKKRKCGKQLFIKKIKSSPQIKNKFKKINLKKPFNSLTKKVIHIYTHIIIVISI